jgi:hypothetical protein
MPQGRFASRLVQITLNSVNDDLRLRPSADGKGFAFPKDGRFE